MPKAQSKTKKTFSSKKTTTRTKTTAKTSSSPTKTGRKTLPLSAKNIPAKLVVKKSAPSKLTESLSISTNTSRNIPNGVWIFFGSALLLFCIAVYHAFLRPNADISSRQPLWETNVPQQSVEVSTD
ncbi:MAG: hypothetical protein LBD75_08345 [Candidatus Peribacteria bacterium]|jgi:hypothetical protein|nr:hypothetical protein [Candidatus Peribacteria bacterium]